MAKKRSMQEWFDAYGVSHKNPTNKLIHWICVPAIYFSVVGLLYSIPVPESQPLILPGMVAQLALVVVVVFYLGLSVTMGIGMAVFSTACIFLARWLDLHAAWPLWGICVTLFVLAWIGQFYGHKIEGKKPSFFEDVQFLMIGPAWLMGFIYRRLGIPY